MMHQINDETTLFITNDKFLEQRIIKTIETNKIFQKFLLDHDYETELFDKYIPGEELGILKHKYISFFIHYASSDKIVAKNLGYHYVIEHKNKLALKYFLLSEGGEETLEYKYYKYKFVKNSYDSKEIIENFKHIFPVKDEVFPSKYYMLLFDAYTFKKEYNLEILNLLEERKYELDKVYSHYLHYHTHFSSNILKKIEYMEKYISTINPKYIDKNQIASLYYNVEKYEKALEYFLAVNKKSEHILKKIAICYKKLNEPEKASEWLMKILE